MVSKKRADLVPAVEVEHPQVGGAGSLPGYGGQAEVQAALKLGPVPRAVTPTTQSSPMQLQQEHISRLAESRHQICFKTKLPAEL